MKHLENKTTSIARQQGEPLADTQPTLLYSDLARICVNEPPQGGFTPEEMRARLRLLDKLDTVNGQITLEDADAEKLQQLVSARRWPAMHADLLQFADDVAGMEDVETEGAV